MTHRQAAMFPEHTRPERSTRADSCPSCGSTLCRCTAAGIEALALDLKPTVDADQ